MNQNNQYDAIIIGSGMSALTLASLLTQFKEMKVLLLERHFKIGGFTHTFQRKRKYSWDVGIHYIGDLHEGGLMKTLFDLISRDGVKFNKMPDIFEKFVYPDFSFGVPSLEQEYIDRLANLFPDELNSIKTYFSDVKRINQWFARNVIMKGKTPLIDQIKSAAQLSGFDSTLFTTKEYLDKNFKNSKLKALLASQWGDYGLPPSLSAFSTHASVVGHYLSGGYYPEGSSSTIAESIVPIIEQGGGHALVNHQVDQIIIKDSKAIGVRAIYERDKENPEREFFAPLIISSIGAFNTYTKLIEDGYCEDQKRQAQSFYSLHPLTTNVTMYLGLKENPAKLGFAGENHWIFSSYDHDKNFENRKMITNEGPPPGAYLSFPSLKDSSPEHHTAEVIAFCEYSEFKKWRDQPWKKREAAYQDLKTNISEKLTSYINSHYPGFSDLIEFSELSTPISTEFFTGHPSGSIYGIPNVIDRFKNSSASFTNIQTLVENLYLTGVDVASPGVGGALMGGIATATAIDSKLSLLKLVRMRN
ncbi:MAG: NAD(P)/FAD-dependent oxidoreductase [Leptospiraceae bacterium]|nr:NAD(P)/FAD-dependent oxidoreductase [Leptospiraceae bacterium]